MKQHCIRCRGELAGSERPHAEKVGRAIVQAFLGLGVIRDAVDAALLASARTRTIPTRRSIRHLALAWLSARVDEEIERRVDAVKQEQERRAA